MKSKLFYLVVKTFLLTGTALLVLYALYVGITFAAGTISQAYDTSVPGITKVTYTCVGDASAGTFPSTGTAVSERNVDGFMFLAVTDPSGVTAPQDNYDIVVNDSLGCDVFGGELANRDETNTEQAMPKIGSHYGGRYVSGPVTVVISGTTEPAAGIVVELYWKETGMN